MLQPTGVRLIAVEPVSAMPEELARAVPGVEVLDGTAQAIPCADGSAEAITAAQAFHWFADVPALTEMHRVLRERGGLGLIWNRRDQDDALQTDLDAIIRRYRGRAPAHETEHWRDAIVSSTLFRPAGERLFRHRQVVDAARLVDRVLSISFMATLSDEDRAAVAAEVRDVMRGRAQIALPYRSDAFLFRRS